MAAAAAIIGLALAGGLDTGTGQAAMTSAALISIAVFLVTGAGNAINDYYDREIDAVNRPQRPIPSGRIPPQSAFLYSIALFIAGCMIAGFVSELCLMLAAFNSLLLFLYARSLKATPLAGNIAVAFLTGSTFLFGGAAAGPVGLLENRTPFMLSFLVSMSREIAKDIEDMRGDQKGGARTLPILAGERPSRALAGAFAISAVALSLCSPMGGANIMIYMAIVAAADLLFLDSVRRIAGGDATAAQKALKKGMALALFAFLAAAALR